MDTVIVDVPERSRFELRSGEEVLGWAEYLPAGESVIIAHTEILEGHEGEGLGGRMVRGTVEAIAAGGKAVIPTCPFAAEYIRRHPELDEFVVPALRGR